MIAATYFMPTDIIAATVKAIALCAALAAAVLIAIAATPLLYICLCCVAKKAVVAALAASPLLIITIQKGFRC